MKDTKFLCIKPELGIDKNEFFQYIEVWCIIHCNENTI
jgi:hypothetical protein